jgi:hypothetical protein
MPDRETPTLLARTYALARGPRVRLRLPLRGDAQAIAELLERRDVPVCEVDVERLLRFDPQRQVVICATAPIGGTETLVGIGAIDREDGAEPHTLVVDERLTDGLGELLAEALSARAQARVA